MYLTWIISKWREEGEWEGIIFPLQFLFCFLPFHISYQTNLSVARKKCPMGNISLTANYLFLTFSQQVGLPTGFCRIILPKLAKKQDWLNIFVQGVPTSLVSSLQSTNFSFWIKVILWKFLICFLKIWDIADFRLWHVSSSECKI